MDNMSAKGKGIGRYFKNSVWLMFDNLLSNIISLLVLMAVARYYGADEYGAYAYVFAIAQLFAVLGQMGLDGLLTRDLVNNPSDEARILGTAGLLRLFGYAIGAISCLAYGFLYSEHTVTEKWLFGAASIFIILTPGQMLLDNWFRSRVEAKYSSIARMVGTLAGATIKLIMILIGSSIVSIGFAQAISVAIVFAVLLPLFIWRGGTSPLKWKFDRNHAKEMLGESWLVFLGSIFALIYLKVDQIMLRWWVGSEEVGIYAVAARMSEVFYFIPAALVTSFFPRLIILHREDKDIFNKRLRELFSLLVLISYVILFGVFVFGPYFLTLAFGSTYAAAGPVLVVHVCSMPFIFMRYAFSRWMVVERFLVFSVISQGIGAFANVILNIILIPKYGMMGAAVATLISYAFASYFSLLFSRRTRPIFRLMSASLINPWYAVRIIKDRRT